MKLLRILGVLLFSTYLYAEPLGWSIGGVVLSSHFVTEEAPKVPFPSITLDQQQFLFIPNISYRWQHWALGADGISWRTDLAKDIKFQAKAGFPSAGVTLSGQKSWFRYGIGNSLDYANGLKNNLNLTAGPLIYDASFGLGARQGDLSNKITLGLPVFLSTSMGITVLASAYSAWENQSYVQNELKYALSTSTANYQQKGLGLIAIFQANERLSFITSATLKLNDPQLTGDIPNMEPQQLNVFALVNYYLADSK